jgi:hypothetical protein
MASSGMLGRMALARTDVSEKLSASFIRVTRISELGTTLAVTSNRRTLRRNTKPLVVSSSLIIFTLMLEETRSYETWVLTRVTRLHKPQNGILHIKTLFDWVVSFGIIPCCTIIDLNILYRICRNVYSVVRFEVFTAVTMNNGVFWVVTPCGNIPEYITLYIVLYLAGGSIVDTTFPRIMEKRHRFTRALSSWDVLPVVAL